ncbi:transposase [Streptomyces sp. NRRL F-4489]|uniref:MarR family winged helix-turn-helix transcriptional regulator n=1 Tax=Streptomyces sp. NRRL F-4489 TaxID=1609095 RepID=UPI00074897F4|nr:MarR family winged helix-turn-helix transcriptional regulator [Streptomyces sp. NRRL F-4489]KUL36835.1 transposase [Streptomyces sp. NRRL F-4489]
MTTTAPHLSDAELASQPAAYWTGLAYEALIAFTRARQAELGFTQPQFWLLRNLSKNDISPDGHGMTIPELRDAMSTYLRPEDDLAAEAEVLLERGWLTRDGDGRLWLTEAGEEARVGLKQHGPAIRDRIHHGIDDADYVTTLKVLQQMIRNTGRTAA